MRGSNPFLSQSGAGWMIRKGLRSGISLARGRSRFRSLPTDMRPETLTTSGIPGRNERCPCGSGKKFKRCCGAV